jgi:uncharacterized UPF0146 family protein
LEARDLARFIAERYSGRVVEVGVGKFREVAETLRELGLEVLTVDLEGGDVADDVSRPRLELYEGASLIYALRPNPELLPHLERLADRVGADLLVRPLPGEEPGWRLVNHGRARFYLRTQKSLEML